MTRLTPGGALDTGIERLVARDRWLVAASLLAVIALAWIYLWFDARMMEAMLRADPSPPRGSIAGALALTFLMWTIMMAGMMLPSAAPGILLYGTLARRNAAAGRTFAATWTYASGYLAVWTAFSLVVSSMQVGADEAGLLTPTMSFAGRLPAATILIVAGVYQWLPLKDICLAKCRSPLEFFVTRWRDGRRGAFTMGAWQGLYCLGCCWALMLVLFVAGVMNLLWVALIAAFVFVEKLLPASRITGRIAGIGLIATGYWILLRS